MVSFGFYVLERWIKNLFMSDGVLRSVTWMNIIVRKGKEAGFGYMEELFHTTGKSVRPIFHGNRASPVKTSWVSEDRISHTDRVTLALGAVNRNSSGGILHERQGLFSWSTYVCHIIMTRRPERLSTSIEPRFFTFCHIYWRISKSISYQKSRLKI